MFTAVGGLAREQQQHGCRLPALLQLLQFTLQVGEGQIRTAAPDHQLQAAAQFLWVGDQAVVGLEQPDQPFSQQRLGQDQQLGCGLGLRHVLKLMHSGAHVNGPRLGFQLSGAGR